MFWHMRQKQGYLRFFQTIQNIQKKIDEEINDFDVISHDLISRVMLSVGKIDNIDPI